MTDGANTHNKPDLINQSETYNSTKKHLKLLNLTNMELNTAEIELLTKNPKYCPISKPNISTSKLEIIEMCRKLRLQLHFYGTDSTNTIEEIENPSLCKPDSSFSPPNTQSHFFDKCLEYMESPNTNPVSTSSKHSREEHIINNLKYNLRANKASILKADKGGVLVIISDDNHEHLVLQHLNDTKSYKYLRCDNDVSIFKKIILFCSTYEEILTKPESEFLNQHQWNSSRFFIQPKIHKSPIINGIVNNTCSSYVQCTYPQDLCSRPIVASHNSPTSRLSHLVDLILKPLLQHVKSHIQDTFDFIHKLERNTGDEDLLVTIDACSLYTSIPNTLGYEAISYWVSNHSENSRFTLMFILEALKLILENNTFKYKTQHFLQINGVAMGTKMAPTYAILTLGYLEIKLYSTCANIFDNTISSYIETHFFRFIDDIYITWPFGIHNLEIFIQTLNQMNSSIKFVVLHNNVAIPFLDVTIYKHNNRLETDIYHKPTDSFNYLPFHSQHPRHVTRNIPYCLARRIIMLVTNPTIRHQRLQNLKNILLELKYPEHLLNDAINKTYDTEVKPRTNNIITYVTTYHGASSSSNTTLCKNMYATIQNHHRYSHIFTKQLICAHKQPPNLLRILQNRTPSISQCRKPRCKTCDIIITSTHTSSENNIIIKPNISMNCCSKNVIYIIKCHGCSKSYVGETSLNLNLRVNLHRSQIKTPEYAILHVSKHINQCTHANQRFSIFPFFQLKYNASEYVRRRMETYFIYLFKPSLNHVQSNT